MHISKCRIVEIVLEDGQHLARLSCPSNLIPAPGQYVLAHSDDSNSLLPASLFYTDSAAEGFLASAFPLEGWSPGQEIFLRGPLGRGFELPVSARKVALIAFDDPPLRLRGLIKPSFRLGAAVVLVSDLIVERLPDEVEIQPLSALAEVLAWADYAAFDVARGNLPRLREKFEAMKQVQAVREAQILIRTLMPCGGIAECGICAVSHKSGWKMVCSDGPVFVAAEFFL